MQSLREEASHACCAPFFPRGDSGSNTTRNFHRPSSTSQITSTRASRSTFVTTTNSTILSSSLFTNHESLPPLSDALSNFLSAYPNYPLTQLADRLRLLHYPHLSLHIPLDYTGFPLFSPSQLPSSSFTVVVSSHNPEEEEEEEEETNNNNNTNKIESAIKRRIMSFLNLSPEDYLIILTVNRASALKLLAESYPFHSHKRLLTVYDHESEAVSAMLDASSRRQAKLMSASFQWPSMRIHSSKLKKMLSSINSSSSSSSSSKGGGLFLLPLQSRVTGTRYSYLWLAHAQQNGWHVALDACGLSPKDMDTLGLSLFNPDFLVCNFFKVFGEDPSGFSCLIVRRDIASLLEMSPASGVGSGGLVRIVPTATHKDDHASSELKESTTTTFTELSVAKASDGHWQRLLLHKHQGGGEGVPTTSSEIIEEEEEEEENPPNPNSNPNPNPNPLPTRAGSQRQQQRQEQQQQLVEVEFRGLDHADSLGLALISSRLRCIVNWLVVALTKLRHPHSGNGQPLVRIYGPRVKFDRGHSIAFNLFDWKGEKVDPSLVQKLADRSNISLTCSFLQNIFFSDKYGAEKQPVLESRLVTDVPLVVVQSSNNDDKKKKKKKKEKENLEVGINVVSLSLGFLASFEDAYNLWMFIAKFLDADFVEKERWRYVTLNQKTVVV